MNHTAHARANHSLSSQEVLDALESQTTGLTDYDVQGRRALHGKNILPETKRRSQFTLFARQVASPLIIIIFAAAMVSFFIGHEIDAIFILFVVFVNTTVGFLQERKAEKALSLLRQSDKFFCRVLRDGYKKEIPVENLVPGDVVILVAGDRVPADGRVLSVHNLTVNESMLTGEWAHVTKTTEALPENTITYERSKSFVNKIQPYFINFCDDT